MIFFLVKKVESHNIWNYLIFEKHFIFVALILVVFVIVDMTNFCLFPSHAQLPEETTRLASSKSSNSNNAFLLFNLASPRLPLSGNLFKIIFEIPHVGKWLGTEYDSKPRAKLIPEH